MSEVCKYFADNKCSKGAECKFLHVVPTAAKLPAKKPDGHRMSAACSATKEDRQMAVWCEACDGEGKLRNKVFDKWGHGTKSELYDPCQKCRGSGVLTVKM